MLYTHSSILDREIIIVYSIYLTSETINLILFFIDIIVITASIYILVIGIYWFSIFHYLVSMFCMPQRCFQFLLGYLMHLHVIFMAVS